MNTLLEITADETLTVRQAVLRIGMPLESCLFDGDELDSTKHFGYFINNKLTAIVSIFKNNNSNFNLQNQFQIRGMAVLKKYQKCGIGKKLLLHSEIFCKSQNASIIWFNARESATGFYESMKYKKVGNAFEIKNIGTHFVMKKELY